MTTEQLIAQLIGEEKIRSDSDSNLPPMIHQDTLLKQLDEATLQNRHLLVTDGDDRIVGAVLSETIRTRLLSGNERERVRWAQMPISHLVVVNFPMDMGIQPEAVASVPANQCLSTDDDHIACIATESDLFLSWDCLSSALAGALSDPLTGLPNRMAFDRRLNEEWNRSKRTGCSIGVILIDMDHFKSVNDDYGHSVGDAVLRDVALRLEQSLRSYDLVVRYGGDEFVVLCLGCDPKEIEIPIRRIMAGLAESKVLHEYGRSRLQASIGAAVEHGDFETMEAKDLFDQADRSLYLAKESRGCGVYIDLTQQQTLEHIRIGSETGETEKCAIADGLAEYLQGGNR